MAAEARHFAAQIPKLTLVLKTNSRTFGEFERDMTGKVVLTSI